MGLLYLRARCYDPAIGRFLSEDPFPGYAGFPQTQHPYVYVGNNPINLTDPSGKIFTPETAWDLLMIALDIKFLMDDLSYYSNPCVDPWEKGLVLATDVMALGLDIVCLAVPILPGGWGTGIRMAGGGVAVMARTAAHVPRIARVGQAVIKSTQAATRLVHMSRAGGGSSGGSGGHGGR